MVSIVILFCDKDFKYIPALTENIKEKVHVPYEIVYIDNRENNKEPFETEHQLYSFGYNARQVQGRKKGIELAKGDYIWFVDADDKVLDVVAELENLCNNNYDFIIFKKSTPSFINNKFLLERSTFYNVGVQLWDKWIKTAILRKAEELIPADLSGIASEDTMLVIASLKFSRTIYFHPKEIYEYQRFISNCGNPRIESVEHFSNIIYGYTEVTNCIDSFLTDKEKKLLQWNAQKSSDVRFFIDRLQACVPKIIPECVSIITKNFKFEDILTYWKAYYESESWVHQNFVAAREALKKEFPEHKTDFDSKSIFKYYRKDVNGNEYCYDTKVNYIEPECMKKWGHTLSIICLVYEGNVKYLSSFLKMTKDIEIEHEVVIVDNRNDKSKPLKYKLDNVVLVETEENIGILDGRRKGFENSNGDYVWFVDIDDEIMDVCDRGFGDYDIIKFPAYNDNYIRDSESYSYYIRKPNVCTYDTVSKINIMLWDKWFKRDILEKVYARLPSFNCVYNEDVLIVLLALEYANEIRVIGTKPMYRHRTNEDSTTLKVFKSNKDVDRLFIGFDEVVKLIPTLKLNPTPSDNANVRFYLEIADRAIEKVQQYFVDTLKDKFGSKVVNDMINSEFNRLKKFN